MPQQLTQKPVTTFIKGLVTEAGELTFPPDASVDESNCDLRRDGSRRRRKGADRETNSTLSTFTISDTDIVHTGLWSNVGGQSGLEYLVVQKGSTLYFYNKVTAPYSSALLAHTVNLGTYQATGSGLSITDTKCQFASIEGALVIASSAMDTIYVTRDNALGTIAVTTISFRTRDFDWQGDISEYDTGDATPTVGREYDTQNAGWVDTKGAAALVTYKAANATEHPPLNLPWYSGKTAAGAFDAAEWAEIFAGSTLIGNGHYILDFFNKDRATPSGLVIATETEDSRFNSVQAFGGRVFYSGLQSSGNAGTIMFSRLIESLSDLGECLQRNDPTSEVLSDLLDTDGGVIKIAEAVGIKKLYAIGSILMVFAENGVWSINGVDGVFRASEYSVKRISDVGIASPDSFLDADGTPIWWSNYGIHTMTFEAATGNAKEQNLSLSTIQTFWDNIPTDSKLKVKSVYDKINKRAYWAWPSTGETVEAKVNEVLVLDIAIQAFYPWTISDETSATDCVVGLAFYKGIGADEAELNVVTPTGDEVITSAGDDVIVTQLSNLSTGTSSPSIVLLIRDGATNKMTMGGLVNNNFLDWDSADYSSYAEAGYEFMGDLVLKKTSPYLTTYMRVTETGWTGSEVAGYSPINESSCRVSAYWDFKSTPSSPAQEAYRLKYLPIPDENDLTTFNYPEDVVTTRLKLRGRGRSVRLKFESTTGKDFTLLGYSLIGGTNGRF
jgi:hypothetical protein